MILTLASASACPHRLFYWRAMHHEGPRFFLRLFDDSIKVSKLQPHCQHYQLAARRTQHTHCLLGVLTLTQSTHSAEPHWLELCE
jgi:hypothetical protein